MPDTVPVLRIQEKSHQCGLTTSCSLNLSDRLYCHASAITFPFLGISFFFFPSLPCHLEDMSSLGTEKTLVLEEVLVTSQFLQHFVGYSF